MSDRYGVIGFPIAHSKSPTIHQSFAQQTAQDLSYEAILGPEDPHDFSAMVEQLRAQGLKGLNVTLPYKLEAFAYAKAQGQLTERAKAAGAVNTLKFEDGQVMGDNTDGQGLVKDLMENQGADLKAKRILILGAGGAVQGVILPIKAQQPSEIVIANRTLAKAEQLAESFGVKACAFEQLEGTFDVVINGTSASLSAEVPPIPAGCIQQQTLCYDMMYGAKPTAFMTWCKAAGAAKTADGLGMLVGQAAESFYLWRGIRPQTQSLIETLRKTLR